MRLNRLLLPIAVIMAACASPAPHAEPYPTQPIRVIVPWPAGGLVDILGRVIGEPMRVALGQPIVIENRTGAGGMIGADTVARALPDGHTLVLTTTALNMNAALKSGEMGAAQMFDPIAVAAFAPSILLVHPGVSATTVKELIALAKVSPGSLAYASAGNGSPAHLQGEMFKAMAGVDLIHVPYKGAPPAINDQIAGRVQVQFANAAVALPQIKAGKLRPLAVSSARRWETVPELPTMDEAGVPGFEASQWLGYLAPRGTPQAVIVRLNQAVGTAVASTEVRARLANSGMEAAPPGDPAGFAKYLVEDLRKWSQVVRQAGIRPQ